MPIIVTDPQLNFAPKVQEAIFSPEELRDRDWMLEGYVNPETNDCASLNTYEDNFLLLQQDIRHRLQQIHTTVRAINEVLQCPNAQEIPEILRNILKFASAIYDDGFKEQARQKQLKRIRRKPARRTTKSRKSRRR